MGEVFHTFIMRLREFIKDYFIGFLDYETEKVMVIKNRTLGIIYRSVQFLVITYFIWYVFISEKAYQESETRPESSVYTVMTGTAVHGDDVLDTVAYVRPSEGGDVISAILRREVTYDQRHGTCAEHFKVPRANCTTDSDCVRGEVDFKGHGRRTGRCVQYYNHTFQTCEVETWCPVEGYAVVRLCFEKEKISPWFNCPPNGSGHKPTGRGFKWLQEFRSHKPHEQPLVEAIDFTVLIRNSIHFPKFKVLRGNLKDRRDMKKYLSKCHYDEETDPYCPKFRLGYIANKARENFTELCKTGGVIGVFINWKCNLDLDPSHCKPTYSFRRLDLRKDQDSSGYYYRFAKYYSENGVNSRTLIKAYGIRLDVIVHGHAGKFSPLPTIISTVTALTSVGICTIICDWIMLTFIDKNEVYSDRKFDEVINEPTVPIPTELSYINSFGSVHSDLSDGVPL